MHMISRCCKENITKLSGLFPAILIIGPRQAGKTTLCRHFIKGEYYDLERPSDIQVFEGDIEFALENTPRPVVIDEAQQLPELFNVLRSLIDEDRKKNGRYYLLGSVNPFLLKNISESLAGRVGIVELTPFFYKEVKNKKKLDELWLKGGYPDSLLTRTNEDSFLWRENYISTFIERDMIRHGVDMSPRQIRIFLGMLSNIHGNILNLSEIGKSMGISYHTVNKYLDILESYFLIRRLHPYHANIRKRLVKSPKFYFRDSGILHSLLQLKDHRRLLESPKRGNSWEGFLIEQIINHCRTVTPHVNFYYFRTHAGLEADFIIESNNTKIGIEIKLSASLKPEDYRNMRSLKQQKIIDQGIVLYKGKRTFPIEDKIQAMPAEKYLSDPTAWSVSV